MIAMKPLNGHLSGQGISPQAALLRIRMMCAWLLLLFSPWCEQSIAQVQEPALEYNRDIRPILAENCLTCHGADSASRKAELRLDLREEAIAHGAIEPGKPDASELLVRLLTDDADLVMPPRETKKQLTEEEKDKIRRWIAAGAEYQPHWAFMPPQAVKLPVVKNKSWGKNEIDHFVLARLENAGLSPAPEADAGTLFRRLHLDITGLPPKPDELQQFVQDYQQRQDTALSEWIDRLMQRPAWGEHRARYWLDAARYADTHGLHFDNYREMWLYRDWVIRSFNRNQLFHEFVTEQLAGDLLPEPSEDQLIATGFQRCNITTNEGGTIDDENLALYAADRVQTFGWVFLGLTTNCAQCHDHKFDPISLKDYYALAAYFRNTTQQPKDGNIKDGRGPVLIVPSQADRLRWEALPEAIATATQRRDQRRELAQGLFDSWQTTATPEVLDNRIPKAGLVAHLLLNEGAGDEVGDLSQPGKVVRAKGALQWIPEGKLGPAPVIQEGSTFELQEQGDFEKNQAFSYGAWVRPEKDSLSAGILTRMDEKNRHRGWDLWQQGRNVAVHLIHHWPDSALKVSTRDPVLTSGKWQHVFVTYDGSATVEGIKIYVDGQLKPVRVEKNTLEAESSIRTETPFRIGQRSHSSPFVGGALQDVRLYEGELKAEEVQNISQLVPLQNILSKPVDKRTKDELALLFEHYLVAVDAEFPTLKNTVAELEKEQEEIKARSPVTHIQKEQMNAEPMAHVLMRGEYDQLGEQVKAAPLTALHPAQEGAPANRLGLAQWVTDPANPLTVRVTVNRFWQQLFGQGLVVTSEDFGTTGSLPSHPELLDWLTKQFQEQNGDVKQFFKLMLMSATYRQSALSTPEKLELDRDNALLSRGPRFRMDAEMIRDYSLASSGLLSATMYGPGVKPYQPDDLWNVVGMPGGDTRNYVQDQGDKLYRRSLYSFWKRMAPPPNLEGLNAPSREVCTVRRERTNTPLQALITLNDPQFFEAARVLAQTTFKNLQKEDQPLDEGQMLSQIAEHVLCRRLQANEAEILLSFQDEFLEFYQKHPDEAGKLLTVGETPVDKEIPAAELAAWTIVVNQMMNLDEVLNK